MKIKKYFIVFITMLEMLTLKSSAQFINHVNKDKIAKGELNEDEFNNLKKILLENSNVELQDTLIIKYDYNNETCWMFLDTKSDDEINGSIRIRQLQIQKASDMRKGISIFKFRQKGVDVNKVIKWDSSIIIDKKKRLFKLVFKKRATCGNSIIVLPNRKFIFIRSDSHFEAINFTQSQIADLLAEE